MSAVGTQIRPELVDRVIELYCDWRMGCVEVRTAYKRFLDALAADRAVAFAAYMAALDREQRACEAYADQIELIETRLAAGRLPTRRPGIAERDR